MRFAPIKTTSLFMLAVLFLKSMSSEVSASNSPILKPPVNKRVNIPSIVVPFTAPKSVSVCSGVKASFFLRDVFFDFHALAGVCRYHALLSCLFEHFRHNRQR